MKNRWLSQRLILVRIGAVDAQPDAGTVFVDAFDDMRLGLKSFRINTVPIRKCLCGQKVRMGDVMLPRVQRVS